jgi:urea transporter
MLDPRDFAAFWGLCGGLMCGATELMLAYSDRVGSPEARRAAWLRLVFGVTMGPIIAEALTVHLVLKIIPTLAMPFPAIMLGWMMANDPRNLMKRLEKIVQAAISKEPS